MSTDSSPSAEYPGGHIKYAFDMYVDYDKAISCIVSHHKVQDFALEKEILTDKADPKWSLTVSIGRNNGIAEVDQIGNSIKDNVFDILCLVLSVQVKNVRMIGHGLIPRPGEGGVCHGLVPPPTMSGTLSGSSLQLSGESIQEIQDTIKRCSNVQNARVGLFRHALNTEDQVLQFLMLYVILNDLYEKQEAVDKFILHVEPSTPCSKSPKNGLPETVYSKLRNQLAHRTNVSPEETRSEIANNLDPFRRIVREALKTTLNSAAS